MMHTPEIPAPGTDALHSRPVPPGDWREAANVALAEGYTFAGLHAIPGNAAAGVRMVLCRDSEHLLITCRSAERRLPTLIDLIPAAQWDEREAHDLHQ
jgi:hypothetical protein